MVDSVLTHLYPVSREPRCCCPCSLVALCPSFSSRRSALPVIASLLQEGRGSSLGVGVCVVLGCGCMVSSVRRGSAVPVCVLLPGALAFSLLLAYSPTASSAILTRTVHQPVMSPRPASSLAFANRLSRSNGNEAKGLGTQAQQAASRRGSSTSLNNHNNNNAHEAQTTSHNHNHNDKNGVSSRRGVLGKVAGGMLGTLLASFSLATAFPGVRGWDGGSSLALSTQCPTEGDVVVSGLGLDLRPMPRREVQDKAKAFTQLQQRVLLEAGTERPLSGRTVNGYGPGTKEDGVWVSAVSGVPLFDSLTKYDSGTGWPSFFGPVDPAHLIERVDPRDKDFLPQFLWRIEVLDRKSGTHLGHVFDDGPAPTGKRYCMNASSMRFVPRAQYKQWLDALPKDTQAHKAQTQC